MEPYSPGRSIMPEWKALERIAKAASEFLRGLNADPLNLTHNELQNAVRDYEILKYDTK